ncbi:hypothetical protein [Methylobacter sp. YRD-M1]|uniref:hypothetical protein n=1 Tax=Methylobacter sp. YRD-M1 TaxID=2911520 RepID=UPI003FA3A596
MQDGAKAAAEPLLPRMRTLVARIAAGVFQDSCRVHEPSAQPILICRVNRLDINPLLLRQNQDERIYFYPSTQD